MTKDDILTAAAQIFREKGYHASSMQEIAEAVNLQKASLYHHITSKQEILFELLDQAFDLLIDTLEAVTKESLPAPEKLRLAIDKYAEIIDAYRDISAVVLLEYRSLDTKLRQKHIPRRDQFESLWRDIIQEGVSKGEFSCENVDIAVKMLIGALNWMIMWYQPDGKLKADEIASLATSLYLKGLLVAE
jgi:AcrR family transcriptional regulator